MDAIEKAVDWAVEYGDVLSVSADTRFPNLVVKGAVGGIEHVISVDNGAYYMEMWRDGSGSYYVTTGAKTVPFPGLAKGARLDEALDRFFRLMARKARTRRRPSYRRQAGRRRIRPYTRKAAPGIGPSRSVGHLRPSGMTPESPAKRLTKRLLADVRKNIIGLSTPRRARRGCPCKGVAKDEGGWSGRPRGWTDESVRSFWRTLTRKASAAAREIRAARVYVQSLEEVPEGRTPQQGPRGGVYYETGGGASTSGGETGRAQMLRQWRVTCPECGGERATISEFGVRGRSSSGNVLVYQCPECQRASTWHVRPQEDKALVRKWGFTECVERMRGHVDDPEAFCAASHKEALGRWPAEDPD